MLAIYRCNEIKDQALLECDLQLKQFQVESSSKLMSEFKTKADDILKKATHLYDEHAKNYHERIYREIREQLLVYILGIFYLGFINQGKLIMPFSQKSLKIEINNELKKGQKY